MIVVSLAGDRPQTAVFPRNRVALNYARRDFGVGGAESTSAAVAMRGRKGRKAVVPVQSELRLQTVEMPQFSL
jgi:hypothetical protein